MGRAACAHRPRATKHPRDPGRRVRRRRGPRRRRRPARRPGRRLPGPPRPAALTPMRPFTAAAVQAAPCPDPLSAATIKANLHTCVDLVERCVAATAGYTPGVAPAALWALVSDVPGPVTEPLQAAAARLGVHLVAGTYERGAD